MTVNTMVSKDSPMFVSWEQHKLTPEYANSLKWACDPKHVEGSLWALFIAGWQARDAEIAELRQRAEQAEKLAAQLSDDAHLLSIDREAMQIRIKQAELSAITARNLLEKWQGIAVAKHGDGRTVQHIKEDAERDAVRKCESFAADLARFDPDALASSVAKEIRNTYPQHFPKDGV